MMLRSMQQKEGNLETYKAIMLDELGTAEFKCNTATEAQRDQVELLYNALVKKGYNKKQGA